MLGISAVPAVLLVIGVVPLPDSPRWYMKMLRRDDAQKSLKRIEPHCDVEERLDEIAKSEEDDSKKSMSWMGVFALQWRKPLMIGVTLAILQQLTGINAIIYYANQIFASAGFTSADSQSKATLWAVGGVNVIATLVAVMWVDRFGRKPLLLIGTTGMFLSLVTVGAMFFSLDKIDAGTTARVSESQAGIVTVIALVVFIASFAFSLGPVVWTVINEIFPSEVRGKAVAVATAANWFAAWLVSQFFLTLVDAIGSSGVFWLFAFFCIVTFIFVKRVMPETKGRTLEEIQEMWGDKKKLHDAIHEHL